MVQEGLIRLPGWKKRLFEELENVRAKPFSWGRYNCGGLGVLVIKAITGYDFSPKLDGIVEASPEEVARRMERDGHKNLKDLVASFVPQYKHPSMARIGDLGIVKVKGPIGQGICMFDSSGVIALGNTGLERLPRSEAKWAFKVGEDQ